MPVDLEVPIAPIPFKSDGKFHVLYELHITSFRAKPLELTRLEVIDQDGKILPNASYADKELKAILDVPGAADDIPDKRVIGGGMRACGQSLISSSALRQRRLCHGVCGIGFISSKMILPITPIA